MTSADPIYMGNNQKLWSFCKTDYYKTKLMHNSVNHEQYKILLGSFERAGHQISEVVDTEGFAY